MKKVSKLMTVVCSAVMLIGAANNFAMSSPNNFTYAVVDVPQVVAASKQVNALKAEQATKLRELSQFVQTANKQLQAEPDATKNCKIKKQQLIKITLQNSKQSTNQFQAQLLKKQKQKA